MAQTKAQIRGNKEYRKECYRFIKSRYPDNEILTHGKINWILGNYCKLSGGAHLKYDLNWALFLIEACKHLPKSQWDIRMKEMLEHKDILQTI